MRKTILSFRPKNKIDPIKKLNGTLITGTRLGHFNGCKKSLEAGADVNHLAYNQWQSDSLETPICIAAANNDKRLVSLFLEYGASELERAKRIAGYRNNKEIIKLIDQHMNLAA